MTSSEAATRRPFTVALCKSCGAQPALAVLEALRATIRRCDHGVLVTTECMLGLLTCAARVHDPGVMVLLQPCSIERVPSGPAHWVGPINNEKDVCILCGWVERGEWDCRALPERLRGQVHRTVRADRRN